MDEIFLYDGIYDWTIQPVLERLAQIGAGKDSRIRVNSGGGSVFAAQGLIADMQKREGKTVIAIDGNGSSMAFFLAVYASDVEILSTTKALVHRADVYDPTEADRKLLQDINNTFKSAVLAKIDPIAFTKSTGKTIDQIFDPNSREEVWLNAADMVSIGLVKQENVFELTPALAAELSNKVKISLGAYHDPQSISNQLNSKEMAEVQGEFNVAAIEANAQKYGADRESARVAAWMVWAEVDLKKVKAGIESGKEISAKETQEFMLAMSNKTQLEAIQKETPAAVTPPVVEPTAEQKQEQELIKEAEELKSILGLKEEIKL